MYSSSRRDCVAPQEVRDKHSIQCCALRAFEDAWDTLLHKAPTFTGRILFRRPTCIYRIFRTRYGNKNLPPCILGKLAEAETAMNIF